jgi:hypothetical protein
MQPIRRQKKKYKTEKQKRMNKQKAKHKMAKLSPIRSIIISNINDLDTPIK